MKFFGVGRSSKNASATNQKVELSSTQSSAPATTKSDTSATASSSYERSRLPSPDSRQEKREDAYSPRDPSSPRKSEASSRDRLGERRQSRRSSSSTRERSSSRGRASSRGRSKERRSGSGRSVSPSLDRSYENRARTTSDGASRASSRGRSGKSTSGSDASHRRHSSVSSRRDGSPSGSRASSRGRVSSASRSSSRGRSDKQLSGNSVLDGSDSSNLSPRQEAYGLTRQETGQPGRSITPSRRSSSRGRRGRSSDSSLASRSSRAGASHHSRSSRRKSSKRSSSSSSISQKSRDSKSEPLLGQSFEIEERDEKGTALSVAVEEGDTDVESGDSAGAHYMKVTEEQYYGISKVSPLENPEQMVNGLLIQLKFESEVCPWPLRVLVVICAIGMITTTIVPFFLAGMTVEASDIIISPLVISLSLFIILLEGRFSFVNNDPAGCRASVRGAIVKNVGFLKLVWGRGLLYIFAGLLQVALMHTLTTVSGGLMVLVGLVVLIAGASSTAQLARLKKALTDDAHLLYLFAKYDKDKDGYHAVKDFARFIVGVGLDLDDAYTLGAFKAIDKDHDDKISFIDFHKWWTQCTVKGNHVFRMKKEEINDFTPVGNW